MVFASIPKEIWTLIGASVSALLMYIFQRKKVNAEVDSVINHSYNELLQAYKTERELLSAEMETLRQQSVTYMNNSNELIKNNRILREEISQLKADHHNCNKANELLQQKITIITEKLKGHGIE